MLGDLQLEVMQVVWGLADATVAEVHERLQAERPIAYTTVLSTMRALERRGFLAHTREGKAHRFHATVTADGYASARVEELIARHFGGRPEKLLSHLLGGEEVRPRDLRRIRKLLEEESA
jgi:predicted transcriptional regulator